MGNLITDFFKGKKGHGRRADDHVDRRAPRTEPVTGLPTGGQALYVRLWTRLAVGWTYTDYTYYAAQ